jgi:CcmD family protein
MRPRGTIFAAALLVAATLGALPSPTAAQTAAPAGVTQTEAPAAAPAEAAAPAAQAAPALPAREPAPRTLRAHWHVFAAFAIAWLLLFGYAVALGRRFARIERTLDGMRGAAA